MSDNLQIEIHESAEQILEKISVDLIPNAVLKIGNALVDLRTAITAAEWPKVQDHALSCMGLGESFFFTFLNLANQEVKRVQYSEKVLKIFLEAFVELANKKNHKEIALELRVFLKELDPTLANKIEKIVSEVDSGTTDFAEIRDTISNLKDIEISLPETSLMIASISRGLQALSHFYFNKVFDSFKPISAPGAFDSFKAAFIHILEKFRKTLQESQIELFNAIAEKADKAIILNKAINITLVVKHGILPFIVAQARMLKFTHHLFDTGKGGDSESAGKLLADAGFLTREAFSSQAASLAIALDLQLSRSQPDSFIFQIGRGLKFDRNIPNGTNTEISKLNNSLDGVFVEVSGYAVSFQQIQSADGFSVSSIDLFDPSSKSTVTVFSFFINFPHIGVTNKSFVKTSGIFLSSAPELGGKPGIKIDVLSLSDLSEASWRIRFLLSAKPWIEPWRNQKNISWSIGTHEFAKEDANAPTQGAAELLFLPFVR